MSRRSRPRRRAIAICLLAILATFAVLRPVLAHDIPNEIILNGYVKPDGERLHVLFRIPLVMLASINPPKRGPGYLALDQMDEALDRSIVLAAREIRLYENGNMLTYAHARARIAQPSDRSFEDFETALALIEGPPLPFEENVFWNQGYFDVHYEFPIAGQDSNFALDFQVAPGLAGRLRLVLRYLPDEGTVRAYEVHGGFGLLALDPRWYQAASSFVRMGFDHILSGIDHLLFLLCLIIPFRLRQFWTLAAIVTSFTIAHSITLVASALGVVPASAWFPPLIEVLIALSIVYMAVENIVSMIRGRENALILRWRWLVTGGFGLVHGFGFSFALREDLQFAGDHLLVSLVSFNVGVELGQLLALGLILPVVGLAFRSLTLRRIGVGILSAFIAHTAWHWMLERGAALQYVPWPELADLGMLAVFGTAGLVVAAAVIWLIARAHGWGRYFPRRPAE